MTGNLTVSGNVNAGNVSASLLSGYLTTASQPNITSVGTLTDVTIGGNITIAKQIKINQVSETITYYGTVPSSNIISTIWTTGNLYYVTPVSANILTLTVNSVPTTLTYSTYDLSAIIDTSSYKTYISTLNVNGTSATVYINGGSAPTITSATLIIQSFVLIFTSSSTPWRCVSSISPFY